MRRAAFATSTRARSARRTSRCSRFSRGTRCRSRPPASAPLADQAVALQALDDVGGELLDVALRILGIRRAGHAGPDRRALREVVEHRLDGDRALLARLAERIDAGPAVAPVVPRVVVVAAAPDGGGI